MKDKFVNLQEGKLEGRSDVEEWSIFESEEPYCAWKLLEEEEEDEELLQLLALLMLLLPWDG